MDALGKGEQLFSDLSEQDPQVINRMLTCLSSVCVFVCLSDYQSFPQLFPQELAPYLLTDISKKIEQAAKDVENAKNSEYRALKDTAVTTDALKAELKTKIVAAEKSALDEANGLKTEMQEDIKQAVTIAKQALQSKVDAAAQGCTHLLSYTPVYIYSLTHIFYTYFITQMQPAQECSQPSSPVTPMDGVLPSVCISVVPIYTYPTLPCLIKSSATDPALNDSPNLPFFTISSLNLRQFDLNKPYLSKLGSLLEKFGDCGHSMAILREGMQTLFGPGYYLTTIPHSYINSC